MKLTIPDIDQLRDVESHLVDVSNAVVRGDDPRELIRRVRSLGNTSLQFAQQTGLPETGAEDETAFAIAVFSSMPKEVQWQHYVYRLDEFRNRVEEAIRMDAAQSEQGRNDVTGENQNAENTSEASDMDSGAMNPDKTDGSQDVEAVDPAEAERLRTLTMEQQMREVVRSFDSFRTAYCGGRSWAWIKLLANPTPEEFKAYEDSVAKFLRGQLFSLGGATTAFLGRLVFGGMIMVISLYFFLLDGPRMIAAIKELSPLDEQYERELIGEFDSVCRAVVLATLISALVQGLLAGIGFYFAGIDNVFLLTILTVCLAMVPFFGAAAVWVPACVWLYFLENRLGSSIGLAIYGTVVVSTVDNFIKPYILHGQSNIHPLVALLSVLGGVTALGPVGLLIGPMIVVFLQTALKILQRELTNIDKPRQLAAEGHAPIEGSDTVASKIHEPGPPEVPTAASAAPKVPVPHKGNRKSKRN